MTIQETRNIYYINKEIKKIQEEIYALNNDKNFYKSNQLTGMPKGNSEADIFADYADGKETLQDMLVYSLKKLQLERKKAEVFLNTIEDAEIRLIIRLRVINNMTWEEIGAELGMERTTVSKKFRKFFKEQKSFPQCQ